MILKLRGCLFQYRILIAQETIRSTVRSASNLSFKVVGDATSDADEPPIFVLHGLLASKKLWKGIAKTIRNLTKRTIVGVDLRNHGSSPHYNSQKYDEMARDILQILDKLGVKSASLVGHNIGGRTAMCTALIAPKTVAGLLVIDISPVSTSEHMKDMYKVLSAMKTVSLKDLKNVSQAKREVKKQLEAKISDENVMCGILSNLREYNGKIVWICDLDMLLKHFNHFTSFPKQMMKGKTYNGPCLFIGGQLSEYIPADDLTGIRELFPKAVITYIPKAGHNVHLEDPKSFMELAVTFLKDIH